MEGFQHKLLNSEEEFTRFVKRLEGFDIEGKPDRYPCIFTYYIEEGWDRVGKISVRMADIVYLEEFNGYVPLRIQAERKEKREHKKKAAALKKRILSLTPEQRAKQGLWYDEGTGGFGFCEPKWDALPNQDRVTDYETFVPGKVKWGKYNTYLSYDKQLGVFPALRALPSYDRDKSAGMYNYWTIPAFKMDGYYFQASVSHWELGDLIFGKYNPEYAREFECYLSVKYGISPNDCSRCNYGNHNPITPEIIKEARKRFFETVWPDFYKVLSEYLVPEDYNQPENYKIGR